MIGPAALRKLRRSGWMVRLRRAVSSSQLRTALALCVLFTSTFQSFVAQAHIHVPPHAASSAGYAVLDAQPQSSIATNDREDRSKRSRGDTDATCPLCQLLAFSGAPLAQGAVTILAPVLSVTVAAVDRVPIFSISAVSYHWTGRGPPLD